MGDLVIELTLALLGAALIGWLFGRLLCKSGEYDERAARRRLETTLAERDRELEMSRETADGLRRQLRSQTEAAALVEQEGAGLKVRLAGMETELQALLGRDGELAVCNARRQALGAELEEQQALVLELRSTCAAQAQHIRELNGALAGARAELQASDAENRRRQEEIARGMEEITARRQSQAETDALIARLQQEKSRLDRQLQGLGAAHGDCTQRLQALAASIEHLHRRIRERGAPGRRRQSDSRDAVRSRRTLGD
jgi:DNA repair exonuclease SbcCD ATPase subunit